MAISDDFTIDPERKLIYHSSGTTVYTVNEFYTYVQNVFDEIMLLSYPVPMSAQTPSEYSFINGWFIPEESTQFLKGGSIKTIGNDAAIFFDGIYITRLIASGYVNCVPSDIGKIVSCGLTYGTLVWYNNTLRKWWIRKYSGTDWIGTISISGGSGQGTSTSVVTGETLFSNVFTIGELEPSTTNILYVQQINPDLVDDEIVPFWGNEHIDILIKTKEANSLINDGKVTIFCREFGNLFSHYESNLSSGGRTPIPLSTLVDFDNQSDIGTVDGWTDVTVTFGTFNRDIGDGISRPFKVEVDCGSRDSLGQVYERLKFLTSRISTISLNGELGSFYKSADPSYSKVVVSPFGTYTGGRFYGARGVWLKNVPYNDTNDYQLIDGNGVAISQKYTSLGTILFDSNLTDVEDTAVYRLFFKQISDSTGQRKFGTDGAVLVLKDDGITPVSGQINSTAIQFDFDYDGNEQAAWLPNHLYRMGDEFRQLGTWYVVDSQYTSEGTFGAMDTGNTTIIEGPTVILVAIGRSKAQYVSTSGTLARTTENRMQVDAAPELNYLT